MTVIPIASVPRYRVHLEPVVRALGVEFPTVPNPVPRHPDDVALIASYGDLTRAKRGRFRRIVLMQHGAGQSYGGDTRTAHHPSYPGGHDNGDVGLFLTPNEHSAQRWRDAYPAAAVEVVGSPRLDFLPGRATTVEMASPVVAFSFHWDYHRIPEMRSAFDWYRNALLGLRSRYQLIGHCHPMRRDLPRWYEQVGIEYVADFDDVLRRADVYACDNSSTLYEFAATDRPVVVLNAPWYRQDVEHGLRFWDADAIGYHVNDPEDLYQAVLMADTYPAVLRENALRHVYTYPDGAAERAAGVIMDWAGIEVAA